jgi:hypothetical protein
VFAIPRQHPHSFSREGREAPTLYLLHDGLNVALQALVGRSEQGEAVLFHHLEVFRRVDAALVQNTRELGRVRNLGKGGEASRGTNLFTEYSKNSVTSLVDPFSDSTWPVFRFVAIFARVAWAQGRETREREGRTRLGKSLNLDERAYIHLPSPASPLKFSIQQPGNLVKPLRNSIHLSSLRFALYTVPPVKPLNIMTVFRLALDVDRFELSNIQTSSATKMAAPSEPILTPNEAAARRSWIWAATMATCPGSRPSNLHAPRYIAGLGLYEFKMSPEKMRSNLSEA